MTAIKMCRGCKSTRVKQFFDLGDQPFANALLSREQMAEEKKYPLSLSFCEDCSLVQLDYTADPEELFSNYFWVTATSSTARAYAKHFCEEAVSHKAVSQNGYVLEVASNDGTFLKEFKSRDFKVLGVDPAANIAKQAQEAGIATKVAFFGEDVAKEIVTENGYPDIVYARNVLPHVANLHDFVEGLKHCCTEDNILILEVHYSGKIVDELHYDSIYHEHLCYFTLKSLTNLLNSHGLYPYDIMQSPISGGSIVLYVKNKKTEESKDYIEFCKKEEEGRYNELERWNEFADTAFIHKKDLRELVLKEKEAGKRIIGYGASARSSTMLNFCEIDGAYVDQIIDQNPLKQGKFTPGTHIQILSGEEVMKEKPDVILLLAWNFKTEILDILRNQYNFKGKVIVPLPYPAKVETI